MSDPSVDVTPDDRTGPSPEGSGQGSEATPGPVFWTAMVVGAAISLFGAVGILTADANALGSFIPWFAGGALLLDLAIVPAAAAIGLLGRKALPAWAWPSVRGGIIVTATLVAFAAPLVLGFGGDASNPTVLPRHYGSGLVSALAVVWIGTALALAIVAVTGRGRRATT